MEPRQRPSILPIRNYYLSKIYERDIMCKNKLPDAPKQAKNPPLDQETAYHINGRSFVVQPVFKQENANSLGEVLLRLMQADCEKSL